MAVIIAEGKYRIAEKLCDSQSYAAYKAVDIEDREHSFVVVNRYERETVRSILGTLYAFRSQHCEGFVNMLTSEGCVDVIFKLPSGEAFTEAFCGDEKQERDVTYPLFESYIHGLLIKSELPMMILNAAAKPENIRVQQDNRIMEPVMLIPPDMPSDFASLLESIGRIAERLLRKKLYIFAFELDFLDRFNKKHFSSVAEIYSAWRAVCEAREVEEPKLKNMNFIEKSVYFGKQRKQRMKSPIDHSSREQKKAQDI